MKGYLLDRILTDETALPKIAQKIIATPLDEVIILPDQVRRLKDLLEGLAIDIGTLIDYPLGSGTISKIIFEINNARKNGATKFYLPIPLYLLEFEHLEALKKWDNELRHAAYDYHDICFVINTGDLKETEKISFAKVIQRLNLDKLALISTDYSMAKHDEQVIRFDNEQLSEIKLLVQSDEKIPELHLTSHYLRLSERGEIDAE